MDEAPVAPLPAEDLAAPVEPARAVAAEALKLNDVTRTGTGDLTDAVSALQSIEQQASARQALDVEVRMCGLFSEVGTVATRNG